MVAFSSAAMLPSVAFQLRCRVVVPATVTVSAVSGLRPAATSSAEAAATVSSVVDITSVASLTPASPQHRASAVAASMNRTSRPIGTPA